MKYSVAIRKNETGEIRLYSMDDIEWDDHSVFWWTDGNFGCDCNREMSWVRAGGPGPEDDPYWDNLEPTCGHDRYSVLYAELEDGTRLEVDDDDAVAAAPGTLQ